VPPIAHAHDRLGAAAEDERDVDGAQRRQQRCASIAPVHDEDRLDLLALVEQQRPIEDRRRGTAVQVIAEV